MSLYALPTVSSAGLGNGLFPWARAELFARELGISVLAPQWGKIRIGPYLRREPEKRRYGSFFHADEHVEGARRVAIEIIAHRIPEGRSAQEFVAAKSSSRTCVANFEGVRELFTPLQREHAFIREKLWRMTREPLRSMAATYGLRFVAMHVRRGDLTRQGFARHELVEVKQYTPLSWFIAMVRSLRCIEALKAVPVVVFSDGSIDELAELLVLDGVHLHRRQVAIADLWTMSNAQLLFASGFSTFGMWASFLGGMPTIYAPGKLQQRVQAGRAKSFEAEVAEDEELPTMVLAEMFANAASAHE